MRTYLTSGAIQFRVKANSPEDAIRKAQKRAETLMDNSNTVMIGVECDQVEDVETGTYIDCSTNPNAS